MKDYIYLYEKYYNKYFFYNICYNINILHIYIYFILPNNHDEKYFLYSLYTIIYIY